MSPSNPDLKTFSASDLAKQHSDPSNAWLAINGDVWDVASFAPTHPGGLEALSEWFGRDASDAYNEVHGPKVVRDALGQSKLMGRLEGGSSVRTQRGDGDQRTGNNVEVDSTAAASGQKTTTVSSSSSTPLRTTRPPLDAILNMHDFEAAAQQTLSAKSFAFYSAAAGDSLSLAASLSFWRQIWFRPRVLTGVKNVDTSTTILGQKYSVPFFSAPAALAKLSHPDGELAMARALAAKGSTIIACNNASYSLGEIVEALPSKNYPCFYQLYVNKDRAVTEKLMADVNRLKPRAIMVTVDLPVVGKREADERVKIEVNYRTSKHAQVQKVQKDKKGSGLARATGSFIDPDLKWEDLKWLKSLTSIPIFLKGVQCAADARKALELGCAGIYLSNHGGRAVDTAQPALLTLLEINATCPEVMEQMEVFVDGGVRRGSDILKAICLGASGVCLGRPFLYAVGYGQDGMEHAIDILQDELETAMQHIGITKLSQAHPGLLNTSQVDQFVYRGEDHPWARKIVRGGTKLSKL